MTQNKEEIFGKILQEKHKAQKRFQEKLAKLTGLDRTFISLIENGKRKAITILARPPGWGRVGSASG